MRFQVADRVPVPEHVPPELVHDFDFLDPPGASDDVQLAWKRLHDEAPDIFWTPRNGGHWIATRGEDIREIQTNHRRFSQRVMTIPASAQVFRILPANADVLYGLLQAVNQREGRREGHLHLRITPGSAIDRTGFGEQGPRSIHFPIANNVRQIRHRLPLLWAESSPVGPLAGRC